MSFGFLGRSNLPISQYYLAVEEATKFILACYNQSKSQSMTEARKQMWQEKLSKSLSGPPKLCSLPPTTEAFTENVKRAHV